MAKNPLRHIAIIMDGNGRWAKKKGFFRLKGHEEGGNRVDEIVTHCATMKLGFLSLYAFSTENWQRSAIEVQGLMALLRDYLRKQDQKLVENRISLKAQGSLDRLPKDVQTELARVIELTSFSDPSMILNVCLSYGGREEIVEAAKKIVVAVENKKISLENLDEKVFRDFLYQPEIPDPDLLIRTGGDMRVSNFLLWQIAYSELHITKTPWPEFSVEELQDIVSDFSTRDRRFGKTESYEEHQPSL